MDKEKEAVALSVRWALAQMGKAAIRKGEFFGMKQQKQPQD